MISVARKARPRRGQNRVQLVNIDGTPVRRPAKAHALSWGPETDADRWELTDRVIGTDSMGADVHESDCVPEPAETDEEWLARLEEQDEAEKARVLAAYQPSYEDMREYEAWSQALDAGTLPPELSGRFAFGEYDAVRRGQVSETELAMQAAGMAL